MNREIKFRGYDYLDNEWYYGNIALLKGEYKDNLIYSGVRAIIINDMGCTKRVDRDTVGQYTGLKDKKGKEIYEGDICLVTLIPENYKEKMVMIWSDDRNGFRFQDEVGVIWNIDDTEMEVIGNIYEVE